MTASIIIFTLKKQIIPTVKNDYYPTVKNDCLYIIVL